MLGVSFVLLISDCFRRNIVLSVDFQEKNDNDILFIYFICWKRNEDLCSLSPSYLLSLA